MDPIKYTLSFNRSTKRFHVYVDTSGTMVPPQHYVPRVTMGETPATMITIIVSTDEAGS